MVNLSVWRVWNFDGDLLHAGDSINAHATFLNNWRIGGGYNWFHMGLDDRATRGGPGLYVEGLREASFYVNGDNRRKVSLNFEGGAGGDGYGTTWSQFAPELTFRPVPAIMATAGIRVNRNVFDAQWVNNVTDTADHYVFAHLDQTTVAITGRLNYTMTPNLSLQLYAQPFVSAGDYNRFKEVVDPRNAIHDARYAPYAYDVNAYDNPDFNVKSFRTTNVLRWEYKPGSALFVVWQQARENDAVPGGFEIGRDMHNIFGVPPTNMFLVKLSYWFNY
jgi:hypothetical protein